jgi:hypothetical protein
VLECTVTDELFSKVFSLSGAKIRPTAYSFTIIDNKFPVTWTLYGRNAGEELWQALHSGKASDMACCFIKQKFKLWNIDQRLYFSSLMVAFEDRVQAPCVEVDFYGELETSNNI